MPALERIEVPALVCGSFSDHNLHSRGSFEGSYGYPYDMVARGWLQASYRRLDPARSEGWRPFLTHGVEERLQPGQIVPVEIELQPSATLFRRGETLRLDVQGRWFFPRNPLTGQFLAAYVPSPPGTAVLHCGGPCDAHLLMPLQPPAAP